MWTDPKSRLSKSGVFALVAIVMCLIGAVPTLFSTVPKACSASGVPVNDLLNNTLIPFGMAGLSGLLSWFTKATPETIAAVVALIKSPSSVGAWLRVGVALVAMFEAQFPNSRALPHLRVYVKELLDPSPDDPVPQTVEPAKVAA